MPKRLNLKLLVFIPLLGMYNLTYSQVNPTPDPDYSRVVRNQHHRLNYRTIDVINSNRPGFSVSPYNVGKGNFQIESGLMGYSELLGINGINGSIKSIGLDVSLRYAFNNKIEVYSGFYTRQNWYDVESIISSKFSILPIKLGASYRINEGEEFIPTMAVRGEISYYEKYNENSKTDLSLAFATQHELARNWVFITNWKVNRVFTDTGLGAILGITNTITQDWSWFVEYFARYSNSIFDNFANVGMAYLLNDDIQLDVFGGSNLDINKTTYYLSVGISWRLDRDKNRSKYNSPNGSERVDHSIYTKYRNKGVK